MFSPRILLSTLFACIPVLLTGCSAPDSEATSATVIGNPITGEGLSNPASIVTTNWGENMVFPLLWLSSFGSYLSSEGYHCPKSTRPRNSSKTITLNSGRWPDTIARGREPHIANAAVADYQPRRVNFRTVLDT